jgi:uncharacterized protein (TIGR02246 family)
VSDLDAEDRLAILELVTRADDAATARDSDRYIGLFTPDGVLDGSQGDHRGREAIRAATGPIWASEGERSTHLTVNAVINTATEEITVTSQLIILAGREVRAVVPVTQVVVRTTAGWRIVRRTTG